jgi:hypothetical protein
MVTIVLDPAYELGEMALMDRLATKRINSRPLFTPLSGIPAYRATDEATRARACITHRLTPPTRPVKSNPEQCTGFSLKGRQFRQSIQ